MAMKTKAPVPELTFPADVKPVIFSPPLRKRPPVLHKFSVGQVLQFQPGAGESKLAAGSYEVVRLLPDSGQGFQYRVRSSASGQERVVRESQIEGR
jgi:hypothetical protein